MANNKIWSGLGCGNVAYLLAVAVMNWQDGGRGDWIVQMEKGAGNTYQGMCRFLKLLRVQLLTTPQVPLQVWFDGSGVVEMNRKQVGFCKDVREGELLPVLTSIL